jgi:hypothetical protein
MKRLGWYFSLSLGQHGSEQCLVISQCHSEPPIRNGETETKSFTFTNQFHKTNFYFSSLLKTQNNSWYQGVGGSVAIRQKYQKRRERSLQLNFLYPFSLFLPVLRWIMHINKYLYYSTAMLDTIYIYKLLLLFVYVYRDVWFSLYGTINPHCKKGKENAHRNFAMKLFSLLPSNIFFLSRVFFYN